MYIKTKPNKPFEPIKRKARLNLLINFLRAAYRQAQSFTVDAEKRAEYAKQIFTHCNELSVEQLTEFFHIELLQAKEIKPGWMMLTKKEEAFCFDHHAAFDASSDHIEAYVKSILVILWHTSPNLAELILSPARYSERLIESRTMHFKNLIRKSLMRRKIFQR